MWDKFARTAFLSLYNGGLTDQEIASTFGVDKSIIRYHRKYLELPANKKKRPKEAEKSEDPETTEEIVAFQPAVSGQKRRAIRNFKKRADRVLEFLTEHGPTPQHTLCEELGYSHTWFPKLARKCFDEVERLRFTYRGQARKRNALATEVYGDLHTRGNIFCIRNDPRLIDYIADAIPHEQPSIRSLTLIMKTTIGLERTREVIRKIGHKFANDDEDKPLVLPSVKKGRPLRVSNKEIQQFYNEGLIDSEIADICGVSKATVCYRRKKMGLPPHRKRKHRG